MEIMMLRPAISAVLFDLDGTLADTDPLHARAWRMAVADVAGRPLDEDDYMRRCVHGTVTPSEYVAGMGIDSSPPELSARKAVHYEWLVEHELSIRPGLAPLVATLRSAGVPMGIVSSSSASSVDTFVRLRWPGEPPDVLITRDDGIARKPDPAAYELALRRLHRAAKESVAVENSPHGVAAAQRAGLRCVAIVNDEFGITQLAAADAIVVGFTAVMAHLAGNTVTLSVTPLMPTR